MSDEDALGDWGAEALGMEYRLLREEIQQSIKNQVRILGYGGAALSVVLGGGLIRESALVVVTLPLLAFFFFVLWNVEQTRMMRAGDYLYSIEQQVKRESNGTSMLWESWLRDRDENGVDHTESLLGAAMARDVYDLHYHSQLLVQVVFMLVIVGGTATAWIWPPRIQGVPFGLGTKLTITLLYASFLVAAVYLLWGTLEHDADDEVVAFRGLDPDDG